jgi:hypothetical protein
MYPTKQINNQAYESGMYKLDSFRNQEESGELLIETRTDDSDIIW